MPATARTACSPSRHQYVTALDGPVRAPRYLLRAFPPLLQTLVAYPLTYHRLLLFVHGAQPAWTLHRCSTSFAGRAVKSIAMLLRALCTTLPICSGASFACPVYSPVGLRCYLTKQTVFLSQVHSSTWTSKRFLPIFLIVSRARSAEIA